MKPIFGHLPKFHQLDTNLPWYFGDGDEDLESAGVGGPIHGSRHSRSPAGDGDGGPAAGTAGIAASAVPTDPLSGAQWHLQDTGQEIVGTLDTAGVDIDVVGVWDDYTDYGVTVVDTGTEYTHSHLVAGVDTAIDGDDDASADPGKTHATTAGTAGIAASAVPTEPLSGDQYAYPPWYVGEGGEDHESAGFGGLILGSKYGRLPAGDGSPTVSTFDIATSAIPTDEFFGLQWHLLNTGQDILGTFGTPGIDINVVGVWDDYTGAGVIIGDVDTGIEYTHPDLVDGINTSIDWDAADNDDDAFAERRENHATAVSGTIVATANNTIGVVGVAYDAEVAGFRMEFGSGLESQLLTNFLLQDNVDISNNSWGYNGFFFDDFTSTSTPIFQTIGAALEDAVEFGRDGFGTNFTFSAGNDRTSGQNVNYHSFQNSPYTITVAAIDNTGVIADFSTPGAAILVSAPGDDIATTDRVGNKGYVHTDYVFIDGTSFSSPIAAGVVALMLEANPFLGYRDVQEILVYSSRQIDEFNPSWDINGTYNSNGGGLHFSDDYGAGLIDAHAAVRLAETWTQLGTFGTLTKSSVGSDPNLDLVIPDATGSCGIFVCDITPSTVTDTITVLVGAGLWIDHVGVRLELEHTYIGDLTITLTSPDGTTSVLVDRPGLTFASQNDIRFDLYSTQFWGETGIGVWTLSITDSGLLDVGTLESWELTLWGDTITDDDTYIYTDEYANFDGGGDAARRLLTDPAGIDTINAAAITTDTVLDLTPGAASTLAGNALTIDGGTTIENAFLGDGDDQVTGNAVANEIHGGRGDDTVSAAGGSDTVWGNGGTDFLFGQAGDDVIFGDDDITSYAVKIEVFAAAHFFVGWPEFILLVDGVQVGGVQTVTTAFNGTDWEQFVFELDLPAGADNIAIQYLNDLFGGPGNDRNLIIDHIEVNGVSLAPEEAVYERPWGSIIGGQSGMWWGGTLDFDVSGRTDLFRFEGNDWLWGGAGNDQLFGRAGNDVLIGGAENDILSGGVGGDVLVGDSASTLTEFKVWASGDPYSGNPKFALFVDGVQIDGDKTVTQNLVPGSLGVFNPGDWQLFTFSVDLSAGASTISVEFLNDKFDGTGTDRNLYIHHIEINGTELAPEDALYERFWGSVIEGQKGMFWNGSLDFDVSDSQELFVQTSGTGTDVLSGGSGDDVLIGGGGADIFSYESVGDGHDTILDFVIAEDTIDLDLLFDELESLNPGAFDTAVKRTDSLQYSDNGDANLLLTIDDANASDFSITFANLSFIDFDTIVEQALLEAQINVGA